MNRMLLTSSRTFRLFLINLDHRITKFPERPVMKQTARERLTSELRHSYMPSIFDAEAIRMRNERAEKVKIIIIYTVNCK